ncbi:MAG: TA system VapC family ribonuclease toxin [Thermocrispum sp.]
MRCVDVNVLVYAYSGDLADRDAYRSLLDELANAVEPLGLPDAVLSGFVRVITNRRIFATPTSPEDAWRAVDTLLAAPAALLLRAGERHWEIFQRLAKGINAAGDDVPDAHLAAYAVENNATWLSADRGFARFDGLRWQHPLDH